MTSIIGGYDTGLFDSSLFLLNRQDRTGGGVPATAKSCTSTWPTATS